MAVVPVACLTCDFFNELHDNGQRISADIFDALAPQVTRVLMTGSVVYFIIIAVLVISGVRGAEQFKKFIPFIISLSVASFFLNQPDMYIDWVWSPLENTALRIAATTLSAASQNPFSHIPIEQTASLYGSLVWMVEGLVLGVIQFAVSMLTFSRPDRSIMSILLLIPYLFVVAIFAAFMVEAIFKYIAVGLIAPLLIGGFPFPFLRPFSSAAIRILVGAAFTIIFAAAAMGFTMGTIHSKTENLQAIVGGVETATKNVEAKKQQIGKVCKAASSSTACTAAINDYEKALNIKNGTADVDPFGKEFILMFIIGFVSILIHMQAKSMASNISGANDGAGPAAATVGGAKMLAGAGIMAASRVGFGAGGIGGSVRGSASALAQQGVIGGSVQQLVRAFSPGGNGGGENPASSFNNNVGPGPSYNPGPAMQSGMGGMDDKSMRRMADMFGAAVAKNMGGDNQGGRSRQ